MKTYKLIFLLIVFTTIGFSALAQMKQPGVVMEYRMWNKKKPLAGVEIDVKYAGSTYSDKKGQFTLHFNSLKPGDKINVRRIEKNGFEIFNKEALDQWNLSSSGKPFTIIMARSKDMKSLRDNYSSLSSSSYKKQYEKEKTIIDNTLNEGKIKQQDYQKQLKELDDWYQQQLDKIENYVNHFSRFDLSEMSSEEAAIIKLVQQGKFEEAIRRYDQLRLTEKYNACVDNLNEIEHGFQVLKNVQENEISNKDSLYAMIQRHIDVLKLTGGREGFEKIGTMLKKIAEKDTQDLRVTYAYAEFLDEQKQYDEAVRFYKMCLPLVQDSLTLSQINRAIGLLELELGHFNQSEYALTVAHNLSEDLYQHDHNYNRYYAQSLNDFGKLYAKMRKFDLAEHYYLKAQEQYHEILSDGDNCTMETASLQNDLGRLCLDMRDFKKAIDLLQDSYISVKKLYDANPKDYKELMANTSHNYGLVNQRYMNYDKAEKLYLESLDLYQNLYKHNPNAYRNNIADITSVLSSLYERTMDTQKAQVLSQVASAQYDTLSLVSSDAVLPSVAHMFKSQLDFYFEKRNFSEIKPIVEKSYELISALYKDYPNVYRSEMCDILSIMGQNYAIHNQIPEAKACFVNAKLLADTLCNDNPIAYSYLRLKTLDNIATISSMMRAYKEDSIYSQMAYDVCRSLNKFDSVVYAPDMAKLAYNQSISFLRANNYMRAKTLSDEAEEIYAALFEKYPLIYGYYYVNVLNLASRIYDSLNDSTEYELYANKAYTISKDLYLKDPKRYVDQYVKCLDNVADCISKSNIELSLAYRQDGLKLINEMYQKEPEVYCKTMGQMYLTTYLSYKFAKDYTNAMAMLDSALKVYQPFYEKEPQAFRMLMATCYFNKGSAGTFIGDNNLAVENYRKALPLYQIEMERATVDGQESVAKDYLDYVQSIHLRLYGIYKEQGYYQEAIEQLEEMLLLEPDDEEVKEEIKELEKLISNN